VVLSLGRSLALRRVGPPAARSLGRSLALRRVGPPAALSLGRSLALRRVGPPAQRSLGLTNGWRCVLADRRSAFPHALRDLLERQPCVAEPLGLLAPGGHSSDSRSIAAQRSR
jgi:hypothetical protein